jgi:outer membrane protein TolC
MISKKSEVSTPMDWLGNLKCRQVLLCAQTPWVLAGFFLVHPQPAAFAQVSQSSSSLAPASRSEAVDFETVFQKVRASSYALRRSKELLLSADAGQSAVKAQKDPSLQVSSNLSAQLFSPFKQQHGLSVSTTLWDFGRQAAAEMRAAAQVLSAEAQIAENEEQLKIRTARFYAAVCIAESFLEIARAQLANAEQKLKTVTSGYKRGERPQSDVVRLRVEVGRAQLFVKRSDDELQWLRSQLVLTLSNPQEMPVQADRPLQLKPMPELTTAQWKQFISETSRERIESAVIAKLRAGKMSLESELDALSAEENPVINGSAGVQGSGNFIPLKAVLQAQVGLQYSLPLGQLREQKRLALLARVRENLLNLEDEIKSRSDKRLQSKQKMEGILGQIELQKTQIASLLEFQKLVRARYFAGRASLLELSNTEDELFANRLELTRLQAALQSAAIDTAETLGGKYLEKIF